MRTYILASLLFICVSSALTAPLTALAYTTPRTETERQELILTLLKEVLRLEKKLVALRSESGVSDRQPYQSVLFDLPVETGYFVDAGGLTPYRGGVVRTIDQDLFDLFIGTLGKRAVATYVAEWRVYNQPYSDVDAAVESIGDSERYVVNINRAGYTDRALTELSFARLFVHEYSHLLFFERPELTVEYADRFWSSADEAHSAAVAKGATFRLAPYYEANTNRFVSEYATVSPDEDMAETFVEFVFADRPTGTLLKDKKVLSYYAQEDLLTVRADVRRNLTELGLLQ